jgi:hypothetical protein
MDNSCRHAGAVLKNGQRTAKEQLWTGFFSLKTPEMRCSAQHSGGRRQKVWLFSNT